MDNILKTVPSNIKPAFEALIGEIEQLKKEVAKLTEVKAPDVKKSIFSSKPK